MPSANLKFNPACQRCKLATEQAVPGYSLAPTKQIKLIVIGGFPNSYDETDCRAFSAVNSNTYRQDIIPNGAFVQDCLARLLGLDFLNQIYFTYAVKCSKGLHSITNKELHTCKKAWLNSELKRLPKVPILVLGNLALKVTLGPGIKLADARHQVHNWQGHKLIVSLDSVTVQNSMLNLFPGGLEQTIDDLKYLYQHRKAYRNNLNKITVTQTWKPILPGTAAWFMAQDLKLLKSIL